MKNIRTTKPHKQTGKINQFGDQLAYRKRMRNGVEVAMLLVRMHHAVGG